MDSAFWLCFGIGVGLFLGWHIGYGAACKKLAREMREDRLGPNANVTGLAPAQEDDK